MSHWILTANRLADGAVAYLREDRTWSRDVSEAWTFDDRAALESELRWAGAQERVVCDPYVVAVVLAPDGLQLPSARERIRAGGRDAVLRRFGYAEREPHQAKAG